MKAIDGVNIEIYGVFVCDIGSARPDQSYNTSHTLWAGWAEPISYTFNIP